MGTGEVVVTAVKSYLDVPVPGVTTMTDENGYFTLGGLQSTSYKLVFTYVGARDFATETRPLRGSQAGSTVNITIPPGYRMGGTVAISNPSTVVRVARGCARHPHRLAGHPDRHNAHRLCG